MGLPMNEREKATIQKFLADLFASPNLDVVPPKKDEETCRALLEYVGSRFGRMKYILGLAIDFTALAQRIAQLDHSFVPLRSGQSFADIEARYTRVESRGSTKANTLTFDIGGKSVGIRKTEELVAAAFHEMQRTNYPSAYVYNTGQWAKYRDLIDLAFRLSEPGRQAAIVKLFQFGLENMERNSFFVRSGERVRLAEEILSDYPRTAAGENAGLTFQSLVFGFLVAEYPHLLILADKVRTGSARQKRIGDIDLYSGLDLEVSVEVKDLVLTGENLLAHVGTFLDNADVHKTRAIVFCREADSAARGTLNPRQTLVDEVELFDRISSWDWEKQDRMVRGMLHFLAHIEQDPNAVTRILAFIKKADPTHSSLGFSGGLD